MCGHVCHNTHIPDVVVCMDADNPNKYWEFQKSINHDEVNLLTHVHFLHLNQGLGSFQRFEEFQEAVCQVEQKSLFNKLQALAAGNKYALHDIYGPGFQIYLSGSVAYVAQCLPVEARIYDPMNCTREIPAEIGSEESGNVTRKYANAQTMILQDFPTRVPCTKEYSPKWKKEDRRYCSYPVVQECNDAPTQLNLIYNHTFCSMRAIFDGIKGGILHSPQVQGSRLWRQLAQCQEAVAQALEYTALNNSPNQEILGKPLDQITMRKVAFASAMMGLFTILNYVFSVTLRIVGLWKERGFGWWLLGGLWAAAYNLLLLPTVVVKNIMIFNRAQTERALPTPTNGSAPMKMEEEVHPLQGGAGSDPDGKRTPDGDAATNSPYSSATRQLVQAREMLALQRREAAETLDNVHGYYERRMQATPSLERPSAPDA
jgi:hypothetical protein